MLFESAILLLALLCGLVYQFWAASFNYWKKRGVPSVTGTIPFGTLGKLLRTKESISGLFERVYKSSPNSPYVGFYGPFTPYLLVRDPELIKDVLVTNTKSFTNFTFFTTDVDPIFGLHPFSVQNHNEWKFKRGIISQLLTLTKVKAGVTDLNKICRALIKYLHKSNGNKIEAEPLCLNFTVDSLALFAFGLESDSFYKSVKAFPVESPIQVISETAELGLRCGMFLPWANKVLKKPFFNYEVCMGFMSMINSNIAKRKTEDQKRIDFFHRIIETNEKLIREGKPGLTDDEIVSLFMALLIDGTDSLAKATLGVLYEIALNEEVQEKLRREIKAAFGTIDEIDGETLCSLPYLDQCIYEGLRVHSIFPVIKKVCVQDTMLGSLELRKGQLLFIAIEQLLLDPRHFPEPLAFDPDRWSSEDSKTKNRFVWIPFGEGPRTCVGMRYSLVLIKLLIATILIEFKMEPDNRYEKNSSLFMFSSPKNLCLKFIS